MTHANVELRMTIGQFGEAMDRVARRRSPTMYVAMTTLGIAGALFLAWSMLSDAPRRLGVELGLFVPFLVYLTPWVRYRCLALVYRLSMPMVYEPYVLERISGSKLYTHDGKLTTALDLDDFPFRVETPRLFAFGGRGGPAVVVFPKAPLTQEVRDALRAVWARPPSSAAVSTAIHDLGDAASPTSLRYTLEPREYWRGYLILSGRAQMRVVLWVLTPLLFLVLWNVIRHDGLLPGASIVLVVVAGALFLRHRVMTTIRATPPAAVEVDTVALRVSGRGSELAWTWSSIEGIEEDDEVLVVILKKPLGVIIPKRLLGAEMRSLILERIGAAKPSAA